MRFQGAIVKEQGVTFAVVIVKEHIVRSSHTADGTIRSFAPMFPGIPVVLMAQDHRGVPTYYGRSDISRFLANVPLEAIPWREYTYN
jgi:hypothetical protein